MKAMAQRLGIALKILGNCLCLSSAACSASITLASILGIVEKTSSKHIMELAFLIMYLVIALGSILCVGEYIVIKQTHSSMLLKLFDNRALSTIKNTDRIWRHTGIILLNMTFVVNMIFARFILGGDGHGLAGTWRFKAAGTPVIISFIAMIPVSIQSATWKMLLKKTGKWSDGPYE